jgi:hypothetical protein
MLDIRAVEPTKLTLNTKFKFERSEVHRLVIASPDQSRGEAISRISREGDCHAFGSQ